MSRLRIDMELDDDMPAAQQARRVAATLRRYANGVESLGCIPNGPIPLVTAEGLPRPGRAWVEIETCAQKHNISPEPA
jgi:hypothetical protein